MKWFVIKGDRMIIDVIIVSQLSLISRTNRYLRFDVKKMVKTADIWYYFWYYIIMLIESVTNSLLSEIFRMSEVRNETVSEFLVPVAVVLNVLLRFLVLVH